MINETLVAAAQYMDKHGKALGMYWNDGRVCMIGAIRQVTIGNELTSEVIASDYLLDKYNAARDRLVQYALEFVTLTDDESDEDDEFPVYILNDERHSSKEETVKFMLEAAEWEPTE